MLSFSLYTFMCHIVSLFALVMASAKPALHKNHKTRTNKKCTKLLLVLLHVQDLNDDYDNQSFLNERPETPAAAERDEDVRGASGLPASAAGSALGAAAGLGLGEILQQRPRSRSTSPPSAEKALDLTPKSQSRPASPETSRSPNARRGSVAKSITESPTAVPLHFRRPPTSPGLSRAVPVEAPTAESPGSPSQQRHRRPGSVEFRNSREIRPLWLVERHSSVKGETEPQEGLPSLPSSKTSSRVPSIEDLKALNDDDGVRSWEQVDLSHSIMENRRPTGLTIETDHANENHDRGIDLLDSQQATPTAEHFENSSPSAKREKLKYEFHSPSELLRNPDNFDPLPGSPTLEALPSAEGSVVGPKDKEVEEKSAEQEARLDSDTPIQEKESLPSGGDVSKGAGFAGIVDAAAIAAVKNKENQHPTEQAEDSEPRALPEGETEAAAAEPKIHGFGDIVDAAVATEIASHDKAPTDEEIGEPGTTIEEDAPVQLEATHPIEATKEITEEPIPETTEQSAGPADTETAEETAMTPAQKRKAKKNKKKNKSQGQSVDLVPEETTPVVQEDASKEVEQTPVAETPAVQDAPVEVDTTPVEPEAVAPAKEDLPETAQPQAEAEPVEASREIVAEPETSAELPAEPEVPAPSVEEDGTAQQPAEAEPAEASRDVGLGSSAAVGETSEPVTAPEPEAEPEVALTAAQKKKAKKDKKKKNKSKDASAVEPADDVAISQPQDQVVVSTETPKQEDVVPTAEEPVLPAEGSDKNIKEQQATEAVFTDANETVVPETTKPEGEEVSRSLEDVDKPVKEATLQPPEDLTAPTVTEPTKEDSEGEDNFQEAVEEQASQPIEEKEHEVAPEPTAELVPEPAAEPVPEPVSEIPVDVPAETPAEPQETKAQKKKNKKKNRKSAAVEETSFPTEEQPTPAPKGETEEFNPEESASTELADTQIPETSGETLPSDPEQPAKDLELPSETAAEEPAAAPEQQQDAPPAESTVDVAPAPVEVEGPTEEVSREIAEPAAVETQPEVQPETAAEPEPESQPQPEAEAEAEAEPDVALTAAQKKKAKKDKKKKNKQSQSSVPDEEQHAESAPTEPSLPAPEAEPATEPTADPTVEDNAKEVSSVPEEVSAGVAPQDTEKEVRIEPEQSVEPEQPTESEQPTELEKVVELEQPQEEATPASIPEPTVEEKTAETPKEEPAVLVEQVQAEETPVEPEVPMTAAQRKKAKKAAKKKQEEEAALAAASDNANPAVHEPVPGAESTETPAPVEDAAVVEDKPAEIEQDAAPAADIEAPTTEETPLPADAEVTESSKDLEPPTQDMPAVADSEPSEATPDVVPALEEAPVPTDVPQLEEPKPEYAILSTC